MTSAKKQQGATLIISLIMLMVVTMLVVYSMRSGNTNLRIAGNMQFQAEAYAATEVGIEQLIEQIRATDLISKIPAQTIPVSLNGLQYNVQAAAPGKCLMEVTVLNDSLKDTPEDQPCRSEIGKDIILGFDGKPITAPSECKNQLWELRADVIDSMSGARLTQIQGLTVRVPATVNCS